MVPVLRDWGSMQAAGLGPKSPADFLRDYCVSSLILSAHFRFKPVVGQSYFLYGSERGWALSLIAPQEWGQRKVGEFVAGCRLRPDMTWDMDASMLDDQSAVAARVQDFIRGFIDTLSEQRSIATHLPFYVASLPYYQRLLGTALASSLQRSLPASGDDMQALLSAQPGARLLATPARVPGFFAAGREQEFLQRLK